MAKYSETEIHCENPELFMAICTYKNHSFIIVGVKNGKTGEQFVLSSFGRTSVIRPEQMPTKSPGSLIDIQAFSLSVEQYQQVFYYIENINSKYMSKGFDDDEGNKDDIKPVYRYIPFAIPKSWVDESQNQKNSTTELEENSNEVESKNELIFVWQYPQEIDNFLKKESNDMQKKSPTLGIPSLFNNCRTTAKDITKKILKADHLPGVSSWFFKQLPFKAHLINGKITDPLFIYPPPPKLTGQGDIEEQWVVLRKIYKRLDEIAKTSGKKDLTKEHEKFNVLKALYQTQYEKITHSNPPDYSDLLTDIKEWTTKNNNLETISEHRYLNKGIAAFLGIKTATRKMIDGILKEESITKNEQENNPKKGA